VGLELAHQGNLREAIGHFQEVLRIQPDYAEAHNNLGLALGCLGNLEEAVRHFREALRIKPGLSEARRNLEIGLKLMKKTGREGLEPQIRP